MKKKPRICIGSPTGPDGNSFYILAKCFDSAVDVGWTKEKWHCFLEKATAEGYVNFVETVLANFNLVILEDGSIFEGEEVRNKLLPPIGIPPEEEITAVQSRSHPQFMPVSVKKKTWS